MKRTLFYSFTSLFLLLGETAHAQTLVKDIVSGTGSGGIGNITDLNGIAIFTANDGTNGVELWRSDGSESGTYMIKDINTGGSSNPKNFEIYNNELYFNADDGTNGKELWKTDGTSAGTVMVKDIYTSGDSDPRSLRAFNGGLFFSAEAGPGVVSHELWVSDGTEAGTMRFKELNASGDSNPLYLTVMGSEMFFSAQTPTLGAELWKSDGTIGGTVALKDLNPGSASGMPRNFTVLNNKIYFFGVTASAGAEPWVSDGTSGGTFQLKDVSDNPSSWSSNPSDFTVAGGEMFFLADDSTHGEELWKTDGTPGGTVLVKDLRVGHWDALIKSMIEFNGKLYFSGRSSTEGTELFESDGTDAGTKVVKDIKSGGSSSYAEKLTIFNSNIYFFADDGVNGTMLWKSDGTNGGTEAVYDFDSTSTGTDWNGKKMAHVGDKLFIVVHHPSYGEELWVIRTSTETMLTETACDSYTFDGVALTTSGTYYDTLLNGGGFDSIVVLDLTIVPTPTISQNGAALESSTADSYQWLLNGSNIAGATSAIYTPTENGDYTVQVTVGSCTKTSAAITYSSVGINEVIGQTLRIAPNPVESAMMLQDLSNITSVSIYNLNGTLIKSFSKLKSKEISIDVSDLPKGIHFLRVTSERGSSNLKFVKN